MNCRWPYWTGIQPSPISFHCSLNIHISNKLYTICVCVVLSVSIHLKDLVSSRPYNSQKYTSKLSLGWLMFAFCDFTFRGKKKNQPVLFDIMGPFREGIEDKLGSEDFSWQAGRADWKWNGKSPSEVIRGSLMWPASHHELRLKSARQGQLHVR